jgi:hypothetical protein
MDKKSAEGIAIEALNFLAADPARLVRFLDLSGLDPASIRAAAGDPGFLLGVLEYVNGDEALLKAFAAEADTVPPTVERALAALGGRAWERDLP